MIMFGNQWIPSVSIFKILSLSIGIQLIQSAVGAIYQSTGHVKHLFYAGCVAFVFMILAIIGGIMAENLELLAYFIVAAFSIIFIVYHYSLIKNVLHQSFLRFLSYLIRPLTVSCGLGIILSTFNHFPPQNIFLSFIIKICVSIFYVIIMQQLDAIKGIPSILNIIKRPFFYVWHHSIHRRTMDDRNTRN